jgi:hypothetical protein
VSGHRTKSLILHLAFGFCFHHSCGQQLISHVHVLSFNGQHLESACYVTYAGWCGVILTASARAGSPVQKYLASGISDS